MKMGNWIDVTDERPNDGDALYLAWWETEVEEGEAMILPGWFIGHEDCQATHWMPLPEPPSNAELTGDPLAGRPG